MLVLRAILALGSTVSCEPGTAAVAPRLDVPPINPTPGPLVCERQYLPRMRGTTQRLEQRAAFAPPQTRQDGIGATIEPRGGA